MTADSEWDAAFAELAQAGAHIRLYPDDSGALYIHAKAIVADAGLPGPPTTPAPPPTPRQPRPNRHGQKTSGAWCTATASVYNAPDHENNVYVYSNQPHQSATASADGYSHSYETNGSARTHSGDCSPAPRRPSLPTP
jgi:hypothetical protein